LRRRSDHAGVFLTTDRAVLPRFLRGMTIYSPRWL
jgi:hypothetical protein